MFIEMRGAFVSFVLGNGLVLTLNLSSLSLLQCVKYICSYLAAALKNTFSFC